MKFRRTFRYHSLRRVRVRQTWNKYNLFNMHANFPSTHVIGRTFFQQKWTAKALTRGYHGEHIKERKWERMFSRRLQSVTNFDPRYMARFDGSEQAAGRGRGRKMDPAQDLQLSKQERYNPEAGTNQASGSKTPYMQMTFAPMERRLDIAVFRALFASSARQARQFVVHGAVTVNGKKMIYPGYLLNPGDMFQVDIDRVLFGTGAKKSPGRSTKALAAEEENAEEAEEAGSNEAKVSKRAVKRSAKPIAPWASRDSDWINKRASGDLTIKIREALKASEASSKKPHLALSKLMGKAYKLTNNREKGPPPEAPLADRLANLMAKLQVTNDAKTRPEAQRLTDEERARFKQILAREAENGYDPSKPYATPWRPRPFMQAFAYIPRYLEVNQNICAAVYLRHPVCRPGFSEVPTPFAPELSQLAFNWYLRRH